MKNFLAATCLLGGGNRIPSFSLCPISHLILTATLDSKLGYPSLMDEDTDSEEPNYCLKYRKRRANMLLLSGKFKVGKQYHPAGCPVAQRQQLSVKAGNQKKVPEKGSVVEEILGDKM